MDMLLKEMDISYLKLEIFCKLKIVSQEIIKLKAKKYLWNDRILYIEDLQLNEK